MTERKRRQDRRLTGVGAGPRSGSRCRSVVGLCLLTGLVSIGCAPASAQTPARLTGTVTDGATGQALPRANIRVLGTSRGTITNAEGRYLLLLDPGAWRIAFSVIGYDPDTLTVTLREGERRQEDLSLLPAPIVMPPVTVRPGITDMAQEVVRRAILARREMMASLRTLRFEAYTRTDMTYIDPDTVEAGEQIGGILETQTEGFWQTPDEYLERIVARRQSAMYTAEQNIFASGRLPSFNRERIEIGTIRILSPLAASALDHYVFTLLDTIAAGGGRALRVGIEPRSRLLPLFRGTMVIADDSWLLLDVDVTGNEAAQRPPLLEWRLCQQFALYEDRYWLPIDSLIRFRLDIGMDFLPIFMEMHAVRYDYAINEQLPPGVFGRYQLEVDPAADSADSTRWEGHQILPLTRAEEEAYIEIEREWAEASPFMRTMIRMIGGGGGGRREGRLRIHPSLRFNRIEGLRPGIGLELENRIAGSAFEAQTGFGFADADLTWRLEGRQRLIAVPEVNISVGYGRELAYREGMQIYTPGGITWQALLYGSDPVDYYRSEGFTVGLQLKPAGSQSLEFLYRDERHRSVTREVTASPFKRRRTFRENPPIIEGRLRSGTLSAQLDTRRLVEYAGEEITTQGRNYIILRGDFEMSDRVTWGSDFSFMRGEALAEVRLHTLGAAYLDVIAMAGNAWGDMPPQRLYDLHGARGGEYRRGAFMTLRPGDFVGDRLGLLWVEHNFSSIPMRLLGVPAGSRLDLDIILHGTVGWCGLRVSNTDLTAYGARASEEIYSEMGVGVGRFMGMLRFDLSWRLEPVTGRNVAFSVSAAF